jgi:hypothetical protein
MLTMETTNEHIYEQPKENYANLIQPHCNPIETKYFLDLSKVYGFKPCIFVCLHFLDMKRHILD